MGEANRRCRCPEHRNDDAVGMCETCGKPIHRPPFATQRDSRRPTRGQMRRQMAEFQRNVFLKGMAAAHKAMFPELDVPGEDEPGEATDEDLVTEAQ